MILTNRLVGKHCSKHGFSFGYRKKTYVWAWNWFCYV